MGRHFQLPRVLLQHLGNVRAVAPMTLIQSSAWTVVRVTTLHAPSRCSVGRIIPRSGPCSGTKASRVSAVHPPFIRGAFVARACAHQRQDQSLPRIFYCPQWLLTGMTNSIRTSASSAGAGRTLIAYSSVPQQ